MKDFRFSIELNLAKEDKIFWRSKCNVVLKSCWIWKEMGLTDFLRIFGWRLIFVHSWQKVKRRNSSLAAAIRKIVQEPNYKTPLIHTSNLIHHKSPHFKANNSKQNCRMVKETWFFIDSITQEILHKEDSESFWKSKC